MMGAFPAAGRTARADSTSASTLPSAAPPARLDGLSQHGLRYRLQGSGPTLVLLHEMGGSLDSFEAFATLLDGRFRILSYDQRGSGASARGFRGMGIADHAEDLAALVAETGIGTVRGLVGVAAGAAIGVTYAAQGGHADTLILCAPALSVPQERRAYLEARSDRARRAGMGAVTEASLARSWPEHLRGDGQAFARYRDRFLANDPQDYADANLALAESRAPDLLPHLAQPCLVLAGRQDLLRPPAEVRGTAARIPGARYEEIESGHLMSVQAPEALAAALLAFLGASR